MKADNRFYLQATNLKSVSDGKRMQIIWRVESCYDFEPFGNENFITDIPLLPPLVLKLPDGLSHYMTKIGVAKEFDYGAEWVEKW